MIFLQVPNLFFYHEGLGVETLDVESPKDEYESSD
jgi:hypothetical protein